MKRTPRRSRIHSPAKSLEALQSERHDPNRSQSVGARSTLSGPISKTRLSDARRRISGIDFVATSYLRDDTAVNSARKEGSWWKALGDNSPFANVILQPIDNELEGTQLNNANDSEASIGGLEAERRLRLEEINLQVSPQISGDSISPHSINVQRKTFFGGRNKARKTIPNTLGSMASSGNINNERRSEYLQVSPQVSGESISPHSINVQRKTFFGGKNKGIPNAPEEHTVEPNTRPSSDETPSDIEITTHTPRKRQFFMTKPKANKPNIEIPLSIAVDKNNKTPMNNTNNLAKTKKIFFQHTKDVQPRGYEKFILESSDSEDSLGQVETVTNKNAHALQNGPLLLTSRRKSSVGKTFQAGSPRLSNASETLEFDNWKLLPSSTMIESAEQSEIYPDTPQKTIQTSKRVSIANFNPIANESNVAKGLQTRRSTRLSHRSKGMSSPMTEKENLNFENPSPVTVSRKLSNVLDASSENIQNRTRNEAVTENYSLNINMTNNRSGYELREVEASAGRSLRSRKSIDVPKDLQTDNIHNTRSRSRNDLLSSLDSPGPLVTPKNKSKLLGPKSVREERVKRMNESNLHIMEAHSERQIIIPEILEMDTRRLSISPVRKSKSNQMGETIHSVTQYAHKSGQSNGTISISKEKTSERLEGTSPARHIETDQDDNEQNNQTDNEEVTLNDGEKLSFSFSHGSGKSNVTSRKSTACSDVSLPSERSSLEKSNRNVSKTIEIDENDQRDQQNVTNNDSHMSAELINNKENTSKASQRKSNLNPVFVNRNLNKLESKESEIQQHERIDSPRQSISSKRIVRASVELTNNLSKQSEIRSNESNATNSLHDNSNGTLENTSTKQNSNRTEVEENEQSVSERQSIVPRGHTGRVSISTQLTNMLSTREKSITKISSDQNSNRTEIEASYIQPDEQSGSETHSIVSRGHTSRTSASAQLTKNQISSSETVGKKSTENISVHQSWNRTEIGESHIRPDEQIVSERHSIVSRSHTSRASATAQLTKNRISSSETVGKKSSENISVHQSSNRTEIEASHIHQDKQNSSERHSIISRGHTSRASASAQLTKNLKSSSETVGKNSTENLSVHQSSNRTEIEALHIQQDKQSSTQRQSNIPRGEISRASISAQMTSKEIAKEKSIVNKSVHDNSKIIESEHVRTTRADVTLTKSNMNEDIPDHRTNHTHMQESPLLSKTSKTATNTVRPGVKERTRQSAALRESRFSAADNNINLPNNDQVGDVNVPILHYTGQKDLTRKSLSKSKQRPNAAKLGSSQSKRTDLVEKTQLEKYLDKIKEQNLFKRKQAEEAAMNSLKPNSGNVAQQNNISMFKNLNTKLSVEKTKPKSNCTKPAHTLVDGKVYRNPKMFFPKIWVTLRLYKFLEKKMEPKYKLKTRVQSEKLVRMLSEVSTKLSRSQNVAQNVTLISKLKRELARMDVVQTHFEFYNFVENYLPYEPRSKIIPSLSNGVPLPNNVRAKIL